MDKWWKYINEGSSRDRIKTLDGDIGTYLDTGPQREGSPYKTKRAKFKGKKFNDISAPPAQGAVGLEEEVEPESFEIKSTLSPKFWNSDKELKKSISRRLQKIADDFLKGLQMDVVMEDLRLTGSLANYNWSKYSDVDLHIVVDFDTLDAGNAEMVKAFFDLARVKWNIYHDIMIYGHEVEIYVENVGHKTISSGIYSIANAEWIIEQTPGDESIDMGTARKKSDDIQTKINLISHYVEEKPKSALKSIKKLKDKIRRMRKVGLRSDRGEFSPENIAFKILRREDALEKLSNLKKKAYDNYMSMRL
jgi:hypothetical protein